MKTELNKITAYDMVKSVCGRIKPIGESGIDAERLDNLEQTILLVDELIDEIIGVASYKVNRAHSERLAGETADRFITDLRNKLDE